MWRQEVHTEKETSILRQMHGLLKSPESVKPEVFVSIVGTMVKDGCVSVATIASATGYAVTTITTWVSDTTRPTTHECLGLIGTMLDIIEGEIDIPKKVA